MDIAENELAHLKYFHKVTCQAYQKEIKQHEQTILEMDARITRFKHEIELDERAIQAYRLLLCKIVQCLSEESIACELVEELKKVSTL